MKKVAPVLLSILMIFVLCASLPISIAANENDKPLKVALCLTGPANDNGWCQLAYDGLVAAGGFAQVGLQVALDGALVADAEVEAEVIRMCISSYLKEAWKQIMYSPAR